MTQIALKLSDELLSEVDLLVQTGSYPSRSEAIRAALRGLVRRERSHTIDSAFAAGFAAHPETDEELADATRLAVESILEEPWEPWW